MRALVIDRPPTRPCIDPREGKIEPHLVVAEAVHGFTGPERFGEAARVALDRETIPHA